MWAVKSKEPPQPPSCFRGLRHKDRLLKVDEVCSPVLDPLLGDQKMPAFPFSAVLGALLRACEDTWIRIWVPAGSIGVDG